MSLQNSYDSKINRLTKVSEIVTSIRKSTIGNDVTKVGSNIILVTEGMDVVPFQHPIYDYEKSCVYVDTRTYCSLDRQGNMVVRNQMDSDLTMLRAKLELAWVQSDNKNDVWTAFNYANKIFILWLSNLISFRLGLSPLDSLRMKALVMVYSIGLYYNGMSSSEVFRQAALLGRNMAIPVSVLDDVLSRIDSDVPRDIDELITAISVVDFGPRARDFSTAALFNMLGGSWFSNSNSTAILALATEYPPAFASLVKMAVDNTMYKKTSIGEIVFRENRQNDHQNFSRAINMLIDKYFEE